MKIFIGIVLLFASYTLAFAGNIKGKTILITAANGELGEGIASSLAAQGYNLIISGRNSTKIDNLLNNLKKSYKDISIKTTIIDFSNIATIEHAAKKCSNCSIDGIVLIGPRPAFSSAFPSKMEWDKNFLETFTAPLEVIRLFQDHLKDNSSIVIISGVTSKVYIPNYPNANILRLVWSGEIKNLAHFFKKRKIRVNAISPGPILTEYHKRKIQAEASKDHLSFEAVLAKKTASIPRGSYGSPEDVGELVSFLISNKSRHLNASNILLDGGDCNVY